MNIYKTGLAAIARVTGEHVDKIEHVVVVDAVQEKTLPQAYTEFKNIVSANGVSIVQENVNNLSVTDINGNSYQLANERIFSDHGRFCVRKPSSLLRHMNNLDFRCENLYCDDQDNLIDLTTHAVRDIQNRNLIPQIKIGDALPFDMDLMLKTLKYIIVNHYNYDEKIDNAFENISPYMKPLHPDNDILKQLLINPKRFVEFVCRHIYLSDYFFKICNLQITIDFAKEKPHTSPILKVRGGIRQPIFVNEAEHPIAVPDPIPAERFNWEPLDADRIMVNMQALVNERHAQDAMAQGLDHNVQQQL